MCILSVSVAQGLVKPDVVFFGEDLPKRFYSLRHLDFSQCDLLLIMGTSLEVGVAHGVPFKQHNSFMTCSDMECIIHVHTCIIVHGCCMSSA